MKASIIDTKSNIRYIPSSHLKVTESYHEDGLRHDTTTIG
jgi:hypothetical protein